MRKVIIVFSLIVLCLPVFAFAQEQAVFEAKVLEVLETKEITRDGEPGIQQNLQLKGLSGVYEDQEIFVQGISDLDVVSAIVVEAGDKVQVTAYPNSEGEEQFVVTDHVRRGWLYFLAILFALLIVFVGKWQGFKSIISLVITFFVIMKFIIPFIVKGHSPLLISLIGAIIILALIIYFTWGFKRKANLAMISIVVSLLITGLLSILFTHLTKLSGLADDNVLHLVGIGGLQIDLTGLLLAGIIIGTLGVLDDVVISQVSAIEQIKLADLNLSKSQLFKRGLKVGIDHISSMTNTLFLAYAGAALPLLLLFTFQQDPFLGFSSIINNEVIAVEVVRTLVGSIGLVLAVPIATFVSAWYLKNKKIST